MSVLDIRKTTDEPVSKIVFYDAGSSYVSATHLKHLNHEAICIYDEDDKTSVIVESKEQTENLIKALQKAIELKWVE